MNGTRNGDFSRRLFAVSRQAKKIPNDADRLRKYPAKFGLAWGDIAGVSL